MKQVILIIFLSVFLILTTSPCVTADPGETSFDLPTANMNVDNLIPLDNRFYATAWDISRADGELSKKGIPTFQVAQQKDELPKRPPTVVKPEGELSHTPQDGKLPLDIQKDIQIKVPEPPASEPEPDSEESKRSNSQNTINCIAS